MFNVTVVNIRSIIKYLIILIIVSIIFFLGFRIISKFTKETSTKQIETQNAVDSQTNLRFKYRGSK